MSYKDAPYLYRKPAPRLGCMRARVSLWHEAPLPEKPGGRGLGFGGWVEGTYFIQVWGRRSRSYAFGATVRR